MSSWSSRRPRAAARAAKPVWLGLVNDPDAVTDIVTWVEAGGPGLVDPPEILDLYTFRPSRRIQQELDH